MRIDELSIQNFKGFENEQFRFNPHFNVVIGKNASGKSSLLDALAIAASSYLSGIDETFIKRVENADIRTVLINGQPKPQIPVKLHVRGLLKERSIEWLPEINKAAPLQGMYSYEGPSIHDLAIFDLKKSRNQHDEVIVFPLIAYYGTGRLWKKDGEISYFKQEEGVFSAYTDCLNPKLSSEVFISWYKTYEDTINKFKQPEHILFLNIFREAISSMVPEWTDMAYNFLEDDLMGIFKNDSGQVNLLPFKNLSDGYRNMIGMVADMVYRCIQLNPGLKENVLTETDGIVLIDELDLHLHPEWQKNVVADLKRVFPKVQFIVTTHSPFIVQSLKKEELIILGEHFIDKDPWRKSVEEISEDEMEVTDVQRSARFMEMVAIAKEYFTLIRQNRDTDNLVRTKIDDARHRLDKLRVLYADDPAYVAMLETEMEKFEAHASGN